MLLYRMPIRLYRIPHDLRLLHVHVFVPFLDQFTPLIIFHALPPDQLRPFRLSFYSVQDSPQYRHEAHDADCRHVVSVQDATQRDA